MYLPHLASTRPTTSSRNGVLHVTQGMLWTSFVRMVLEVTTHSLSYAHWKHLRSVLLRFTEYRNLQTRPLSAVTQLDVDLYFAKRRGDTYRGSPICAVTINNEARMLNQWLRRAGPRGRTRLDRQSWGLIADPPYCERMQEDLREVETVSAEQMGWFAKAADAAEYPVVRGCPPGQFWRAALSLALVSAVRRRALLAIPRPTDQMLLQNRELLLPAHLNKTRQDLRISIGDSDIVSQLAALPSKPGDPLLPWRKKNGEQNSADQFSRWFSKIQQQAGVPAEYRFCLKSLRATAATIVATTHGEATAKTKLGHSRNTHTLNRYYLRRTLNDMDRQASTELGRFVSDALRSPK